MISFILDTPPQSDILSETGDLVSIGSICFPFRGMTLDQLDQLIAAAEDDILIAEQDVLVAKMAWGSKHGDFDAMDALRVKQGRRRALSQRISRAIRVNAIGCPGKPPTSSLELLHAAMHQ